MNITAHVNRLRRLDRWLTRPGMSYCLVTVTVLVMHFVPGGFYLVGGVLNIIALWLLVLTVAIRRHQTKNGSQDKNTDI